MAKTDAPLDAEGPNTPWAAKRARQAEAREQVARGERTQESCFLISPEIARAATVEHRVLSFADNPAVPDIDAIIDTVTSYLDGYPRMLAATGMTVEVLDELLLNNNIEKCPNCDWHTDSFNLVDEMSEPDGFCDNCRGYDKPADPAA